MHASVAEDRCKAALVREVNRTRKLARVDAAEGYFAVCRGVYRERGEGNCYGVIRDMPLREKVVRN